MPHMEIETSPLNLETIFSVGQPPKDYTPDPDRLERSGHVVFEYQDGRYPGHYEVRAYGPIFPETDAGERTYIGHLNRDETWMLGTIHDCLAEWEGYIDRYYNVPRGAESFTPDRRHIQAAGLSLAQAGDNLFSAIFLQGDAGLREIGDILSNAMRSGEQVITFYSDRLFIPWGIIYSHGSMGGSVHDNGACWSPDGFWGYRHLLEHEFIHSAACLDHRIPLQDMPLQVGLNLDLSLDDMQNAPVTAPVRSFFAQRGDDCEHVVRSTRAELGAALSSAEFRDQVVYFCCHCGTQQSPYGGPSRAVLRLTDEEFITPAHLCGWLRERNLLSNPFVFINACAGGLLGTQFYCSFGHELIRKAANCVIGPTITIPGAFAGTYAVELFERFLEPQRHLGLAMRDVTRHLMDDHHTPLGLIYALYRGLDTRLVAGTLD